MRCMKKIDEAFNEDDHPRGQPDNDGQFVASGTGSKTKTKRKTKRKTSKPKQSDSAFSWRDISKPLSTKQKFNYRSRSHDIKVYRSRGKNYPQTINISKATNPEYVRAFTGFWNTDPSIKAMIKHIDYLGLEYQNNPKRGGVWYGDDKKVIIYDYPYQSLGHFKSTTVHEIVGHTFWDLAREYFRNDLIEFNELANKMPPVNQYCKDNEEKWKSWNDEKRSQISALDKKYGVTKDEYGYTDASTQLWGEDADKYQEAINKINDGKFIGNPSNEFMNRDSSSMTRYANEQHSAITEIMYGTLKDSSDEGAKEVLIGKEDLDRMKVLWLKLHPKFPQKSGESWNPFNEELTMRCMKKIGGNEAETLSVIRLVSSEAFQEQEHPRDGGGKFAKKGSVKSDKETVDKVIDKIKNTWDDVSPTVHGSHFLTPNGEIIGNYNHNTMVTDLAPMIDGFELTGKIIHGGGKLKNMETGEWYDEEKTIESYAGWKDITNFLAHTGFVRATNEGMGESGYGHTINLTVNGTLTNSQIRAIQKMEKQSAGGTTLNFDIMGDETQSGHGTFRDFMKAYRKNYGTEAFVEDEHPRDEDGKFSDKDGGQPQMLTDKQREKQREEHEKNIMEQDKKLEPYFDKQKKEREITHGKDWEEFDDIFRKYPDIFKEGDYPDISSFNDEIVTNVMYENEEFWKDEEWNKIDSKLDKLKEKPKSFSDLKDEMGVELYDVKDDKDRDVKADKIRDKLRNEKYDKIRSVDEWRYVNADKVLSDLEKEYEETGESYIKDRIDQQKKYLEYHKKDADVERRIYNLEKRRLKNMIELAEDVPDEPRIVGVSEITDELAMNYHNFMADKYEQLEQVKHTDKIEKLNKKKWDMLNVETEEGFNPRMTNVAYTVEYGTIVDLYNDMKTQMKEDSGYTQSVGRDPSMEEIKALYDNIPKKITDYMDVVKNTESDYERSISFGLQDIKNDIQYNVVTPLINDGYGISAVMKENRTHYWKPTKESIESTIKILTRRKNIDYWSDTRKNFQTRLHAGKGPPFNVGDKKHTEGGHWSKTANEIKIYNVDGLKELDRILPHEFAHSQFSAIEESADKVWAGVTFEQIRDGKLNEEQKNAQVFYTFSDEVKKIKEGVESTELPNSIKKNNNILENENLESYQGGIPEKVFTKYFMDYVRARDGKDVKDRRKAESIDTEMFACLSELKYSNSVVDRRKLFIVKLAYPKLFKAYESMEGGVKGLPKDKITDEMKVGFFGKSNVRDVMNALESKGKSYKVTEYLNVDHEPVDPENADIVWVKEYNSNNKLIGMESFIAESEEGISDEAFVEDEHPRDDDGKFADKGGSVSDIKNNLQKNIEPTEKETEIQTKIDVDVRARIQEKIDELGLTDKVDYIETQGSYVKGTDLPSKGSDMDIFVVFNPNVGEEERKDLGLKIGLATLDKEYANSQGWDNFKVDAKDQANKYAEAFFDVDGQTVEVQIVPTRNMDRYDIIKKEINGQKETADGKKISIGMERTPHQTKFMNENLSVEQKLEVRTLKKFMKETGLYDSSVKSQGFSGYSTEVLIHNLGSFENVVDYFADYKMGDVVGLPSESERKDLAEHGVELTYVGKNKETKMDETKDKYTKEYYNTDQAYKNNSIHMTDPIDPNRDIGGAISESKLAKTILTMKHVKEYGKAPDKVEPTTMNGVSLTFTSSGTDENTVGSQVQKLQKNMIDNLKDLGFKVEKEFDEPMNIVKGLDVNPNRTSIEQEKGSKEMTLNFGMNELYNDSETKKEKDVSDMKEQQLTGMIMGMDKKGTRYEHDKEKGIITTYNPRQFKNVRDAVKGLLEGSVKGKALEDSALLKDIREQNVDPFTKFSKFENIV